NELVTPAFFFECRILDLGSTPRFEPIGEETVDRGLAGRVYSIGQSLNRWGRYGRPPKRLTWEDNDGRVAARYHTTTSRLESHCPPREGKQPDELCELRRTATRQEPL
ncbi:MAG: hypothetical protein ACK42I_10320, partial [Thermomicrobium sp.]